MKSELDGEYCINMRADSNVQQCASMWDVPTEQNNCHTEIVLLTIETVIQINFVKKV
jgi:hypothetical protein